MNLTPLPTSDAKVNECIKLKISLTLYEYTSINVVKSEY